MKSKSRQSAWQQRHRDAGLCTQCSEPVVTGYKRCVIHHDVGKRGVPRPRWSPARQQQLKDLWNHDVPVAIIAAMMACKRGSVYSQIHRLFKQQESVLKKG